MRDHALWLWSRRHGRAGSIGCQGRRVRRRHLSRGSATRYTASAGTGKSKTPVLIIGGSSNTLVTKSTMINLKSSFEPVQHHKYSRNGDKVPVNRDEMLPIMQFFARRLQSRRGVPEGKVVLKSREYFLVTRLPREHCRSMIQNSTDCLIRLPKRRLLSKMTRNGRCGITHTVYRTSGVGFEQYHGGKRRKENAGKRHNIHLNTKVVYSCRSLSSIISQAIYYLQLQLGFLPPFLLLIQPCQPCSQSTCYNVNLKDDSFPSKSPPPHCRLVWSSRRRRFRLPW